MSKQPSDAALRAALLFLRTRGSNESDMWFETLVHALDAFAEAAIIEELQGVINFAEREDKAQAVEDYACERLQAILRRGAK